MSAPQKRREPGCSSRRRIWGLVASPTRRHDQRLPLMRSQAQRASRCSPRWCGIDTSAPMAG
eukprot:2098708-Prymnesium_polylepis.1